MMDYFPEEGLIKCIDGIRRDESRIIAHCTSSLHPGPLTYQLMKKHKCIKKKCGNLRIVPAAEYWQQKKRAKEKRVQRREETKSEKILEQDILDYANDTVKDTPDVFLSVSGGTPTVSITCFMFPINSLIYPVRLKLCIRNSMSGYF